MKRHSLKIKLTIIMAVLVTAVIALICIIDTVFFEKYYFDSRTKELRNSYESLKSVFESDGYSEDDVDDEILRINSLYNINVFVIDGEWNMVYSSQNNFSDALRWIQDILFSMSVRKDILEENSEYTIIRAYDKVTAMSYLEIYGMFGEESQIIMQITIENIQETIDTFNRFILIIGAFILIISIVVVYVIASGFTRPVKQLSDIAEHMSEMNFDVKYSGKHNSEIGVLGHSINVMSDKLERNISELKAANLELQKDIEVKTKNDEMRREFLSNVSHELKTPITLIQGYAEGLSEGINDDEESRNFYCGVIMDEAAKMNDMVKKLLTLNQIEFGSEPVEIEHFDMRELVDSVLKANSLRIAQNGIELVTESGPPAMVWSDQIQIEEVFTNFITNAINHCEEKNLRKIIQVTVEIKEKTVRVGVYNTGENIPDEDIDRIWEKFYKVDKARTREYGGNGIGLSIVKAILDNFNSDYGVENQQDGVFFWFETDSAVEQSGGSS